MRLYRRGTKLMGHYEGDQVFLFDADSCEWKRILPLDLGDGVPGTWPRDWTKFVQLSSTEFIGIGGKSVAPKTGDPKKDKLTEDNKDVVLFNTRDRSVKAL